ncbi:Various polyols ABC transporter, permease component 1 [Rhodovastum atsumiense]|uniref:Sugar ABC transporter permease n=1 Tax=Rhodovastum atsumiense TaxID=504468 RepID=A0A5M6IQ94_9PROT|nr:sugar ABC transporter permease [Rhodovastum atsumiense]KAA5610089.1 sugar ABC transporter permease [Rhodovastum atsumiense]CAH2601440.1 Various polyols ABC transporter, permease component 1 [Rhodovastum atsumiense]
MHSSPATATLRRFLTPRPRTAADGQGGRVRTLPLVAPAVGLLLLWSLIPLAMTLYFSFRRYNMLNPDLAGWAGFNNYRFLLRDPALVQSLWVTVLLVGAVLAITVCLGAVLAALFQAEFPGRGIARVMMISPFFVMPTVSALIWKNLLMHPVNGLFAWITGLFGLPPVDWFAELPLASVIMIVSWEWLPFAFLILLTALQSLDEETLEAARLDGAGPVSIFRHVQVPHMGRAISVVVMMETIFLLGVFAEIYVTTSGGPGLATTNLAFLIYQRALLAFNVGSASAAGVIAIVLANIMAAFLVRTVARKLDA